MRKKKKKNEMDGWMDDGVKIACILYTSPIIIIILFLVIIFDSQSIHSFFLLSVRYGTGKVLGCTSSLAGRVIK